MVSQNKDSKGSEGNVIKRKDFDADFVFGSATSSYQIEGAFADGGRGLSIWDAFALHTPEKIEDGSNGNVSAQQYHMFKEDVNLMKKTGLDAYRFSISWSRVLPGGKLSMGVNKEGIKYYNDLIDTILANGLKPYVTLFHWDLPLALELEYGGFRSKRIVEDFRDFAELCFWEFGDRVKHWITVNEAWTYAYKGYVNGTFPPARGSTVPKDIEKHAMASIASRDLLVLQDRHLPFKDQIQDFIKKHIEQSTDLDLDSIEDLITLPKKNCAQLMDIVPGFTKEHVEVLENKLSEFLKDLLIGLFVNYKTSKKAQPCSQGDPGREPYVVGHNILLAHAAAVDLYRKHFKASQGGQIGMTNNANYYKPYHKNTEDEKAARRALDFMFYWFVEPLVKGEYPQTMMDSVKDRLPSFTDEEKQMIKGSYDFLGVNIYTTYYVKNQPKAPSAPPHYDLDKEALSTPYRYGVPIGPKAGSDWLYIYPKGIYKFLIDIRKRYYQENPLIYITENGVDEKVNKKHSVLQARHDETRVDYHNDHLFYVKQAINDKNYPVNVKAYFIWSFADNFEWAEGYNVRFGIFYVDFINGRCSRYPKSSALWWMNFLSQKNNDFTNGGSLKRIRDIEVENDDTQKKKKPSTEHWVQI